MAKLDGRIGTFIQLKNCSGRIPIYHIKKRREQNPLEWVLLTAMFAINNTCEINLGAGATNFEPVKRLTNNGRKSYEY